MTTLSRALQEKSIFLCQQLAAWWGVEEEPRLRKHPLQLLFVALLHGTEVHCKWSSSGAGHSRRQKEKRALVLPSSLKKVELKYIDVAVLVQRIFTADETMDVTCMSHPAAALKGQIPQDAWATQIFLCHHLLLFSSSQSEPWPVTATFLLSPWHSAPSLKGVTAEVKFRSRHYFQKVSFNAAGFGCPPVRTHCTGPGVHFCECCPPS